MMLEELLLVLPLLLFLLLEELELRRADETCVSVIPPWAAARGDRCHGRHDKSRTQREEVMDEFTSTMTELEAVDARSMGANAARDYKRCKRLPFNRVLHRVTQQERTFKMFISTSNYSTGCHACTRIHATGSVDATTHTWVARERYSKLCG